MVTLLAEGLVVLVSTHYGVVDKEEKWVVDRNFGWENWLLGDGGLSYW